MIIFKIFLTENEKIYQKKAVELLPLKRKKHGLLSVPEIFFN